MRFLALLVTALATPAFSQTNLELRKPLTRESAPGRSETFTLQAESGDFIHIQVRKRGVNVTVSVTSPAGATLLKVNSPNGAYGPEPISFMADQSGTYQITVAKFGATGETGAYEIEWTDDHPPIARDAQQIDAERLLTRAVAADTTANERILRPSHRPL